MITTINLTINVSMSKKEPISLHHKPDTRLCLNCGFPNRASDKLCMYCKTSLFEEASLLSWIRQTYLILRWRWQLKERRDKANGFFSIIFTHSEKLPDILLLVCCCLWLASTLFPLG